MHHYRYLKNLSDHHTNTCETLTTFNKTPKKFTDKEKRRAWMNHPDTDYVFYSLNEGTIASTRISKRGGNKVEAMYGFVVEYDNIDPDWDKVVEEIPRRNIKVSARREKSCHVLHMRAHIPE